jgi:uncharacterized protein DUF6587
VEDEVEFPLQTIIVAVIVLASAVFAAWRLSPARVKLRLLDRMKPDTAHVWGRFVARLRRGVAEELTHGCSACARGPTPVQKRASR